LRQLRIANLDVLEHGQGDITLILMHGAGAGQRHPFMAAVSDGIAAQGIRVVTFDFPYLSAGRKLPDRPPVLLAALDEVVRAMTAPSLFVGGKSLGGRMAATWLLHGGQARGFVALGYPLCPPKPQPQRAEVLAAVRKPGLIIQGSDDEFGSPSLLAATAPAQVLVHELPGTDHSFGARKRGLADVVGEVTSLTAAFLLTAS